MSHERSNPTVLLVDGRDLRRAGLVSLLADWATSSGVSLVAVEPTDAINIMGEQDQCRMVVLSIGGESIREREVQQNLRVLRALGPGVPIVILSDREEVVEMRAALGIGAQGFIPSSMNPRLALQAISFILNGGSYFPPSAIREPGERQTAPAPPVPSSGQNNEGPVTRSRPRPLQPVRPERREQEDDPLDESRGSMLTPRQGDVLRLLKEGHSNKVIARNLGMTEATVKVHMRQIMRKLGAQNRTQAALCVAQAAGNGDTLYEDDEVASGQYASFVPAHIVAMAK
jgi:DNA-binding NarL/FixJ family response regulator